ncbi:MAG: 16S rRNA (adenine(1518)-N(6)/adenine(1519)-N(6))-dimethyltransferase RsmA, partial [Sinobacterium sp.]|nr:16S rRNA (adenine(1518)-N(6)/adenine(1519)-N(6))-dimethyltransferase RsmA [Sinobacterium sp.]
MMKNDNAPTHKPRKRFGQNFLQDQNIIGRLVTAIKPKPGENMVEIGPGQAALTTPLLEKLGTMHAVELDRDLISLLEATMASKGLKVHACDALKFDFSSLFEEETSLRVVGNLPYNISTPLLFHLLTYEQRIKDMHFMLQLEVVDRLAAGPGSKTYGKLSVVTQYYCQIDKLFNVPPGAFFPPPKVMSAIVRLVPRKFHVEANDEVAFKKLVTTSFSQRRKTLRNNLKQLLSVEQLDQLASIIETTEALDIKLSDRPETL